jgi:hypothetical protein
MKTIGDYEEEADKLFSKYITKEKRCDKCGDIKSYRYDCAHIITRGALNLKYDPLNAMCLCRDCHREFHDRPKLFRIWISRKYPSRYKYLLKKKYDYKYSIATEDYETLIKKLKEKLRKR